MLKKIAILLAACMLVVSLAACGNSGSSSSSSPAKDSGDGTYKMTYVVSVDDEYLNLLYHATADAAVDLGINLDLRYAGQDSNKVINAIEQAKAQGRGAISLRGKMIDAPIVTRARQTIAMAEELGMGRGEQA